MELLITCKLAKMSKELSLPSVWSRVSYGHCYSVAGHLCKPFYIYSVTCLSTFYVGKAHLVDEETVAQRGQMCCKWGVEASIYSTVCPCEEEGEPGWNRHSFQEASEHVIFLQMAMTQAM